jgi:branched-chain amino acid transport system substrate-binding protein
MELGSVQGAAGKAYADAFKAKYTEGFKTSYTGYGYDGVLLTAAAIEKAKATTPAAIQAALKEIGATGFPGVTGTIRFDQDRQRVDPPYDKLKFEGGKLAPR